MVKRAKRKAGRKYAAKDMYLFKKDGKGTSLHIVKTKKRKMPFLFA